MSITNCLLFCVGAESVLEGSVIFPRSKVAFMIVELSRQLLMDFSSTNDVKLSRTKTSTDHSCGSGTVTEQNTPDNNIDGVNHDIDKNDKTAAVLAR